MGLWICGSVDLESQVGDHSNEFRAPEEFRYPDIVCPAIVKNFTLYIEALFH